MQVRACDLTIIGNFESRFTELIEQIAFTITQCANHLTQISELREHVGSVEPTPTEAQLLEVLRTYRQERDMFDMVDLKVSSNLDGAMLWEALQGLYDKNYIRVRVELKDD